MRYLRRFIWCVVALLVLFVIAAMIALPTRHSWLAEAPWIGQYLTNCAPTKQC